MNSWSSSWRRTHTVPWWLTAREDCNSLKPFPWPRHNTVYSCTQQEYIEALDLYCWDIGSLKPSSKSCRCMNIWFPYIKKWLDRVKVCSHNRAKSQLLKSESAITSTICICKFMFCASLVENDASDPKDSTWISRKWFLFPVCSCAGHGSWGRKRIGAVFLEAKPD